MDKEICGMICGIVMALSVSLIVWVWKSGKRENLIITEREETPLGIGA